jgi:hypothetical protein
MSSLSTHIGDLTLKPKTKIELESEESSKIIHKIKENLSNIF